MRQWAEEELWIPTGPFADLRFRADRLPPARLLLDAIDTGRWRRTNVTAITQGGKTFAGWVIPLLYHTCEIGEQVVGGVPSMAIARDKWFEDLLPVIEKTKYRDLLPRAGAGSKGGLPDLLRLRNGAAIRWMAGGGDDKSRANFTARVSIITETDGLDEAGERSREADPVTQIEGRTRAFADVRNYLECTVSTETGRTWQEHLHGTTSRIAPWCPHCGQYVDPEPETPDSEHPEGWRQYLVGWQDAESELEAEEQSGFCCPACGTVWSEGDRWRANANAILVHRGQRIDPDGTVHGTPVHTRTLSFRWGPVNNLLVPPGLVGAKEWKAARAANAENAERELRQFDWAIPAKSEESPVQEIDPHGVAQRVGTPVRGELPDDTVAVTAGVDLRMTQVHYLVMAWTTEPRPHVVDYDWLPVDVNALGLQKALEVTLGELAANVLDPGWRHRSGPWPTDRVWVDFGWEGDVVRAFVAGHDPQRYTPAIGRGEKQQAGKYTAPKQKGRTVKRKGHEYHLARDGREVYAVFNSDAWKSWLRERLRTPVDRPDGLTLYHDQPHHHLPLARHFDAEEPIEQFFPDRGLVTTWVKKSAANHWLDCATQAAVAAHDFGVPILRSDQTTKNKRPRQWWGAKEKV